jgi:hypothetical protein
MLAYGISTTGSLALHLLIRQVRDELRDWTLGKVIWVADRGFTSAQNRRHLAAGGGGYILGEKLRSGSPEAAARAWSQRWWRRWRAGQAMAQAPSVRVSPRLSSRRRFSPATRWCSH